jgi:hypothetical protein
MEGGGHQILILFENEEDCKHYAYYTVIHLYIKRKVVSFDSLCFLCYRRKIEFDFLYSNFDIFTLEKKRFIMNLASLYFSCCRRKIINI